MSFFSLYESDEKPSYTPITSNELFNAETWSALADSDYDLTEEDRGVIFSYMGSNARLLERAFNSYRRCADDGDVFRWVCFWGIVIGFCLIDNLATTPTQKKKKKKAGPRQAGAGLPDSSEALDRASVREWEQDDV